MYKLPFRDNLHKLPKQTQRFPFIIVVSALFMILFSASGIAQNLCITNNGALPDASAMLDIVSTNKGLLVPRVRLTSTTDVITIANPATSLLVYNINVDMADGGLGFWYWNGERWVQAIGPAGATGSTGPTGVTGLLSSGTAPGNTPFWNGTSWIINNGNFFNNGGNVGIGTTSPNSTLQVNGSLSIKHTVPTVNQNYTVLATDNFVDFSKFTTPITCYLPSAVGIEGRIYIIKSFKAPAVSPVILNPVPPPTNGAVTGTLMGTGIGTSTFTDPATGTLMGVVAVNGTVTITDPVTRVVTFTGTFGGPAAGAFTGPVTGPFSTTLPTTFSGSITGNVTGIVTDPVTGNPSGTFNGTGTGSFIGLGSVPGNFTGPISCPVKGQVVAPAPLPVINAITVIANGIETIDGSSTYSIGSSYGTVTLISDGAVWLVIGRF